MFSIQHTEEKVVSIKVDHQNLFANLQFEISVDDHQTRKLPFVDAVENKGSDIFGSYIETNCRFKEEKDGHQARIIYRSYENFLLAFIRSELAEEKLFQNIPSFSAKHAITVTVKEAIIAEGILANYQHKDWWTRPFFTNSLNDIPEKVLSLLIKTAQNYFHLLPVTGSLHRTELAGSQDGLKISVSPYQSGFRKIESFAFILGKGPNPYALVEDNVKRATSLNGYSVRPRKMKEYPEILTYLGWCSWDAFYHEVDEEGLLAKTKELHDLNIPVKWVMIDDGWSEVKDNKLFSFAAERKKFPRGLTNAVNKMKKHHGIDWVGVWHTIAGYWEGIHPDSSLANRYQNNLYKTNRGAVVPYPDPERGFGFWNEWHRSLKHEGIDFVKVDSQSALANFFTHEIPIGKAASGAHTALESSVSLHFKNTMINCMGMAEENIWHRPYSAVSRNSDDFVPKDEFSFREHAVQNAYNSFYHGSFYWGDWDMYWSRNHDDIQNMILRVVSGGPIYISDEVGKTNPDLIMPLVYQDGKIIRCDQPGMPTEDCLLVDPLKTKQPLKIWNTLGGTGVLAAFNVSGEEGIAGKLGPLDIPGLSGGQYIMFNVLQKESHLVTNQQMLDFKLGKDEAILFVAIPVKDSLTPLGLIDKLIPTDAIVEEYKRENFLTIRIKEGGRFAFYSRNNRLNILVNGEKAKVSLLSHQKNIYVIDCPSKEQVEIEIKLNEQLS